MNPLRYLAYTLTRWMGYYLYAYAGKEIGEMGQALQLSEDAILGTVALTLGIHPLLEFVTLFFPIHFAMQKEGNTRISLIGLAFAGELLISWLINGGQFSSWIFIKLGISAACFLLFYGKAIGVKTNAAP